MVCAAPSRCSVEHSVYNDQTGERELPVGRTLETVENPLCTGLADLVDDSRVGLASAARRPVQRVAYCKKRRLRQRAVASALKRMQYPFFSRQRYRKDR